MLLIFDTDNFRVDVIKHNPEKLCFKLLGVPDNMKEYIRFLRWHHNYNDAKLLDVFPEYVEIIIPNKNAQWLIV